MVERSDRIEGLEDEVEELEEVVDELEKELVEKIAHPLELFFDLVFVFAITQVVSLIVQGDRLSLDDDVDVSCPV